MLQGEIEQYTVLETLGAGGMGSVYKAVDRTLGRTVAIKSLREDLSDSPETVRRLEREARIAAAIDHPFICKIYELVSREDQLLIVMEYVDGMSLEARLSEGPLKVEEVVRLARELSEALGFAHDNGLVHRDVKPANVMLTEHGHAKVMDFGVAKELRRITEEDTTTLTLPGAVVGTLYYMSPEQAAGEAVDGRTDIFAFGVLLHRCLTGVFPFEGDNARQYLRNVLAGEARRLGPEYPEQLRSLVSRCLEQRLERRFQSFDQVTAALDEMSGFGTPAAAASRGLSEPRDKRALLAGAVVVLIVLVIVAWQVPFGGEAPVAVYAQEAVVTWPTVERGSRISPDGRIIAFLSDRGAGVRLWLRSLEGDEPRAVSPAHVDIKTPVWSPQADRIAFLFLEAGKVYLEIISPWGEATQPAVAVDWEWSEVGLVRWLGDSLYVVAPGDADDSGGSLWRLDLLGGEIERVTVEAGFPGILLGLDNVHADVSRDERRLVFTAAAGSEDLWISTLTGRDARALLARPPRVHTPRWLDDDQLVYVTNEGGLFDVWAYELSSDRARALTSSPLEEQAISVSADGLLIVADTARQQSHLWMTDPASPVAPVQVTNDSRIDLWPAAAIEGEAWIFHRSKKVLELGFSPHDMEVYSGVWSRFLDPDSIRVVADGFGATLSPDGAWIAFMRESPELAGQPELWALDLRTRRDPMLVTERFAYPGLHAATWSWRWANTAFRGDELYFVGTDASRQQFIASTRLDSEMLPPVRHYQGTSESERLGDLRISPDGSKLAFVSSFSTSSRGGSAMTLSLPDGRAGEVAAYAAGNQVYVKGWSDDRVLVMRSYRGQDRIWNTEILLVRPDGDSESVGEFDGVNARDAILDPRGERIFMTRTSSDATGVYEVALDAGTPRRVLESKTPGISFVGYQITREDNLIYARKESSEDVWLFRLGA